VTRVGNTDPNHETLSFPSANIDYLKSIVVQYLSKPPGSSERSALLPVLATLLQFDKKDYKFHRNEIF